MLSKFEERLEMYAAGRPVTSDDELFRAVEKIMDEEFALPPEQRDPTVVREGTEALMNLRGTDPRALNSRASAVIKKRAASARRNGGASKFSVRRVLPAAAIALALILAVVGVALSRGGRTGGGVKETSEGASSGMTPSVLPAKKENVVREYGTFSEMAASEDLPPLMSRPDFSDPGKVESVTYIDYGDHEQVFVKMRSDKYDVLTVTIPSPGAPEGEYLMVGEYDAAMTVDDNGVRVEWIRDGNLYTVCADSEDAAVKTAEELSTGD